MGAGKRRKPAAGGVDSVDGIRYNSKEFKTGIYRQKYRYMEKRGRGRQPWLLYYNR